MDKKNNKNISYIKFLNFVLLILICFFGFNLLKRLYFNEFYYKVPALVGVDLEEAEKIIKKSDLNIRNMGEVFSDLPYGKIGKQEPIEGKIVKKGRNIKIWVSKNKPVVFLENLVGLSYVEATLIAKRYGLVIDKTVEINSPYPINEVIATSPKSGEPVVKGQKISFIISNGRN
ncbi:MAG: PASTA domain-containing protein [Fusobacterium sp.]|nr:PASTA domain-containing protein [Fusobacterium sp.]